MPSSCRTQRPCSRSLSTCWVREASFPWPQRAEWGISRELGVPAWTCIRHPPPSLPLPTDVSKLTDTICGVGNMSVNASDQERTPWHVTFKVWGRRGRD